MKIKTVKILIVSLAFLIMAAVVVLGKSAVTIDLVAGAYLAAVSAFLGVDIKSMIKETSLKPANEWEALNTYKYVICFIEMAVLAGLALWQNQAGDINISAAVGLFGSGGMIIIGLVLSGLEGNKAATLKAGEND
jgi:hypothetical protein